MNRDTKGCRYLRKKNLKFKHHQANDLSAVAKRSRAFGKKLIVKMKIFQVKVHPKID
jgi:7-keto-8-aminopelargonate synthetase-like enzyme